MSTAPLSLLVAALVVIALVLVIFLLVGHPIHVSGDILPPAPTHSADIGPCFGCGQ